MPAAALAPAAALGGPARLPPGLPPPPGGDPLLRFEQTQIYERQAPVEAIRHDVARLREHDSVVEARARRAGRWCIFWWVATIVWFVGAVIFAPLALLCVASLIVAIVQSVRLARAKKLDLENRRYELCGRLLEILESDIDPRHPVHVRLDLRRADHADKLASQTKRDPWTIRIFRDEWLWIYAALLDGSRMTFRFTERKVVRSGWKRGYSGKMKYKTKSKSKYDLGLQIAVRPRKHPNIDQIAAQGRGAIRLLSPLVPKGLSSKKGQLRLKAGFMGEWNEPGPDASATSTSRASLHVATMFLSLYQIIHLSRRLYDQRKVRTP